AFWAIYSLSELSDDKSNNKYIYIICMVILFALALSGGRTGYATWAAIGFVFSVFKWRKFLFYGPLVVFMVILILPAARDRLLMGFSESTSDSRNEALVDEGLINENSNIDLYTVTSGRTIAWPFVIDKIQQRPFIGYGKESMIREGLSIYLWTSFQEAFPHPHNMYLQWLMDNGLVGFIPVMVFYITLLLYSFSLLKDNRNRNFVVIGGAGIALILALMISGFGSQTFYPREGSVGMWCVIGLLLRLYVQRSKYELGLSTDTKNQNAPIDNNALWSQHNEPSNPSEITPKFNYYSSSKKNG
ncbi:MAG: O-antigen ligase family protein, partial [Candidatus Thiodiazotropha sp. (ex Notomyrtea botanica)]|nr:O-antigen ligase family protein [Candidatus Thiodiazotropha sp. (ex Notomyrtea botanica)]